ncbi:hypothetical protein A7X12_00150 [Sphingomonas sp. TDK1]|nr:hypothetical protein A7X12_00150 [Sphingomonas sp. TDK1]
MHLEVTVADEGVGPSAGAQLALADDLPRPLGQHGEDVERARANLDRHAMLEQQLPAGFQNEGTETEAALDRSHQRCRIGRQRWCGHR